MFHRLQIYLMTPVRAHPLRSIERGLVGIFILLLLTSLPGWRECFTSAGFHAEGLGRQLFGEMCLPVISGWLFWLLMGAALGGAGAVFYGKWRVCGWLVCLAVVVCMRTADAAGDSHLLMLLMVAFGVLSLVTGSERPSGSTEERVPKASVTALQAVFLVWQWVCAVERGFHGDWLRHVDVLHSFVMGSGRTAFAAVCQNALPDGMWSMLQYAVLGIEGIAPFLLLRPQSRLMGLCLLLAVHLFLALLHSGDAFYHGALMLLSLSFLSEKQWLSASRFLSRLLELPKAAEA